MKTKLFNLENKYYYGFTRSFWHLVSLLVVIGGLAAIIVIGWSYFPPKKKDIVKAPNPIKEAYPPDVEVPLGEIISAIPKKKEEINRIKSTTENSTIAVPTSRTNTSSRDTTGMSKFQYQLGRLKTLMPVSKYTTLWNGSGYYDPKGERLYKTTKRASFRQYIQTGPGLEEQIVNSTDNRGFRSYLEKAELVSNYIALLEICDTSEHEEFLKALLKFKNGSFNKTAKSLTVLKDILKLFEKEQILRAYDKNINFLEGNPNDGIAMLEFELGVLPEFVISERYDASNILQYQYSNKYNNNLVALEEITKNFTPYLNRIDANKQAIALNYFYIIYHQKNKNRANRIQQIEQDYNQKLASIELEFQNALANEELNFQTKKQAKSLWRTNSFKVIAISLGGILIITIILLLLSMVRNVNKLASIMIEQQKSKP